MKTDNEVTENVDEKIAEQSVDNTIEESTSKVDSEQVNDDQAAPNEVDPMIALTTKCNELNDKNLRLMAEFDNYRKRSLKERSDLIKTAGESILVDLLPLIDDFERGLKAMESSEDVQAVKDGVELIYSKFCAYLTQKGVKSISTENQSFDTEFHEAVTTFPAPTEDLKGKIIDCVSKGYTLHDKVIRFSKVVVGE